MAEVDRRHGPIITMPTHDERDANWNDANVALCLREEIALLKDVWGSCMTTYDESTHHHLLNDLWAIALSGPFERISVRWQRLGFQSPDPVDDLRGIGAMGLAHLASFCASGAGAMAVRRVVRGDSSFPLAAASLNVSQLLCTHLHVLSGPVGGSSGTGGRTSLTQCSAETLRNAVRLQTSLLCLNPCATDSTQSTSLLALMHTQLLRNLFDRWETTSLTDGREAGARLLHAFPSMLAQTREHMQHALANTPGPWSVRSVLVALRVDNAAESGVVYRCTRAIGAVPGMPQGMSVKAVHWLQPPCPPSLYRLAVSMLASLLLVGAPPAARA